jgi:hypothetical protein
MTKVYLEGGAHNAKTKDIGTDHSYIWLLPDTFATVFFGPKPPSRQWILYEQTKRRHGQMAVFEYKGPMYGHQIEKIVKRIFAEPKFTGFTLTRALSIFLEPRIGAVKPEEAWLSFLIDYKDNQGVPHEIPYQHPTNRGENEAETIILRSLMKAIGLKAVSMKAAGSSQLMCSSDSDSIMDSDSAFFPAPLGNNHHN